MVIVVMIIGLLSAITMPRVASVQRQNHLRHAALTLAEHLRLARETAMARATPITVLFTPAQSRYEAPQIENPERPGQTLLVNLRESIDPSVTLTAEFNGVSSLEFGIDGLPRAAGQPVTTSSIIIADGRAAETVHLLHGWGTAHWQALDTGDSGETP